MVECALMMRATPVLKVSWRRWKSRAQAIWRALTPSEASAIRLGPRLVASARIAAWSADRLRMGSPVRKCGKQSENPVQASTSAIRSVISTSGMRSRHCHFTTSADLGTAERCGETTRTPSTRRTPGSLPARAR